MSFLRRLFARLFHSHRWAYTEGVIDGVSLDIRVCATCRRREWLDPDGRVCSTGLWEPLDDASAPDHDPPYAPA